MENKKGILYLIPSPIGNLKEFSPRQIETLNSVDYVFCEDTRNTLKLLTLFNIKKNLISCHEHNEKEMSKKAIDLLNNNKNIAYLSDAGYPGISDPGEILVKECVKNKIKIVPLSGSTASLNALVASALSTSHFLFYGFLPSKTSEKEKEINNLKYFPYTIIFYEAPHRINETINLLYSILGDRKLTIAREISKIHEEFIYSSLKEESQNNKEYKGELVLILEGNLNDDQKMKDEEIIEKYNELIKLNINKKDIILILTNLYKLNKNYLKKCLKYFNKIGFINF